MKYLLILFVAVSSESFSAEICSEDSPDTSGMYQSCQLVGEQKNADKNLQKSFANLIAQAKKQNNYELQSKLKLINASQQSWLSYRNATCALEGVVSGAGASWQTVRAQKCAIQLTEERQYYLDSLKEALANGGFVTD